MNDTLALLMAILIVGAIFLLIVWIERRVKKEGWLFTKRSSRIERVSAMLLGLVFGALFLYELTTSSHIHVEWPIVSLALIAYGFGASNFLINLQGSKSTAGSQIMTSDSESSVLQKLLRLLLIVIIGVSGIAAVFYGGLWSLGHPEAAQPFVVALAIGFMALIALHYLSLFFKIIATLKKSRTSENDSK